MENYSNDPEIDVNDVLTEFAAVQDDREKLSDFVYDLYTARTRMEHRFEDLLQDRQRAEDRLGESPHGSNLLETNPLFNTDRMREMAHALNELAEIESAANKRQIQLTTADNS